MVLIVTPVHVRLKAPEVFAWLRANQAATFLPEPPESIEIERLTSENEPHTDNPTPYRIFHVSDATMEIRDANNPADIYPANEAYDFAGNVGSIIILGLAASTNQYSPNDLELAPDLFDEPNTRFLVFDTENPVAGIFVNLDGNHVYTGHGRLAPLDLLSEIIELYRRYHTKPLS